MALGLLLGVGVGLAVQLLASVLGEWPIFQGRFNGPDPYMRLNRILECRGGPGCSGGLYGRSNAPFGEVLHWPFLQDWLLLGLAAPFRLIFDERAAIETAAYLFGPLLQVGAVTSVLVAARPLSRGPAWVLAGVFLVCQLWVLLAFAPSRPDHHGLQALLFLVSIAAAIQVLVRGPASRATIGLGLALGLGLWVSVEGLVTVTVPLLALGLRWAWEGGRPWAWANAWAAGSCAVVLAVGLWLDGPAFGTWALVYDRLSVVHGASVLGIATFWVVTAAAVPGGTPMRRLAWCACGAVVIGAVLSWIFPGLVQGPLADVDPRIVPIWLHEVAEYVPLPDSGPGVFLLGIGTALIAIPAAALAFRESEQGERWAWGLVLGGLVWFGLLGFVQGTRWSYYAQMLTPIPFAWLAGRVFKLRLWREHRFLRAAVNVGVVLVLTLGVPLSVAIGRAAFSGGEGSAPGSVPGSVRGAGTCPPSELGRFMEAIPGAPSGTAILATVWWGPELLYRTELDVIATPYHRNAEGILFSFDVMRATDDVEIARRLNERNVGLIALCPGEAWGPVLDPVPPGSLYHRLREGHEPPFIQALSLPSSLAGRYRLWRVERAGVP